MDFTRLYKRLSVGLFGGMSETKGFQKLKPGLQAALISLPLRTYVSILISTTILVYLATLAVVLVGFSLFLADSLSLLIYALTLPLFAAFAAFALLYFYPGQKAKSMRKSIENDLPFALAHLSAIASSGIPPEYMFELLTEYDEYREIARHSSLIVRNIKTFGMPSVKAIAAVADKTPSPAFKQVLNGIVFNIEKGGNIVEYLNEMSDKAIFGYRLKREKYLKTLSTYADIYTALLVAAPLMMLAVLGILGVIGGQVLGMTVPELITYLTFIVLPGLNLSFLAFIHLTYPGV